MSEKKSPTVSAEFAVSYAAAMYLAQQFEQSMRAILFLGDKFDLLPKLKLSKSERNRFKDTTAFLDEAGTSGRLLKALDDAGLIKNRKALQEAVNMRNELAHWFLAAIDFENLSDATETELIARLDKVRSRLFYIVHATREIQKNFEQQAELKHEGFRSFMSTFGMGWSVSEVPRYVRRKKGSV